MKRTLLYGTIVILVFIAFIRTFFSYQENTNSYTITYTGNISDEKIVLFNTFSGYVKDENYDIVHQLNFQENNNKLIDLSVQQKLSGDKNSFTLKDYTIANKKANYWLDVFGKTILDKHKNKEIYITDTGFVYKTTTIPGLLQNTTKIEGSYTNQLQEKNKFTIILQTYCGIGQYFKKIYGCEIEGKIDVLLPIKDNKKSRKIKGEAYKTRI